MTIWLVWDGDYDADWVVAVFDTKALADDYAETFGGLTVTETEVLSSLPRDAADPAKRAERAQAREEAREKSRREYAEQKAAGIRQIEWLNSHTIQSVLAGRGRPNLCHCEAWNASPDVTAHGYCRY